MFSIFGIDAFDEYEPVVRTEGRSRRRHRRLRDRM